MCYGGNIPYVGVWGLQHICQAFGVCQYIHWMSIMLHQVSTSTAMTVMSSGMSSISSVTMTPSLMGLPTMLGQHDVALLHP